MHDIEECVQIYNESQEQDLDFYQFVTQLLKSYNASDKVIQSFGTYGDENAFLEVIDQVRNEQEEQDEHYEEDEHDS